MGMAGTDLARESADVVLADDNFASIVHAIEEGRIVFVNARQTSSFLITTNIAESVTLLVSIGIGLPLPLTATQLLWLNLVTDTMTSISLATEPGHRSLEHSGEAVQQQKLLSRQVIPFLIINVAIMSTLAIGALAYFDHVSVELGRTAAFVAMAFTQLFNVFNMRSLDRSVFELGIFSNKFVNWAIAISGGLVVLLTYVEPFVDIFKFQSLPPLEFIILIILSSLVLWAGELYKFIVQRRN
jgi:Ca2+-transporting ATPase